MAQEREQAEGHDFLKSLEIAAAAAVEPHPVAGSGSEFLVVEVVKQACRGLLSDQKEHEEPGVPEDQEGVELGKM